MNKRYRIPKRQSRMEHPEKLASLGTVDTGRRQTTLNTKQNTKNSNTALNNTTVIESYLLANILPLPLYKKPAGDYTTKQFYV